MLALLKEFPFKNVYTLYFTFITALFFTSARYWWLCIYIFLAFIFPSYSFWPFIFKEENNFSTSEQSSRHHIWILKIWQNFWELIISSLLHSFIYIRLLNLVVFSFSFLLLPSCSNSCNSLPSRWVLFLLRQWLMVSGHHVPFLPLQEHGQSLTIAQCHMWEPAC